MVATQAPAQAQATAKSWAPTQAQAQRRYGRWVSTDNSGSGAREVVVNSFAGWVLLKANIGGEDDDVVAVMVMVLAMVEAVTAGMARAGMVMAGMVMAGMVTAGMAWAGKATEGIAEKVVKGTEVEAEAERCSTISPSCFAAVGP